jgi:hypothetical protein
MTPPSASRIATTADLRWYRDGKDWILCAGRRKFGRVVPDAKHPGMWRSLLSDGRLSDMANITWAKHAVYEAAIRELEYTPPSKSPVKEGSFYWTSLAHAMELARG